MTLILFAFLVLIGSLFYTKGNVVVVSTESELRASLIPGASIELSNDITLTSTIDIISIGGLSVDGKHFSIDGGGNVRCFFLSGFTSCSFINLDVRGCNALMVFHLKHQITNIYLYFSSLLLYILLFHFKKTKCKFCVLLKIFYL